MIILVNCKWRQEDIKEKIESVEVDGEKMFKLIKTDNMRMYFAARLENYEKNVFTGYMLIMKAIMQIPGWAALAISILPVVNGSTFEGYKYTVCRANKPVDCQHLLK